MKICLLILILSQAINLVSQGRTESLNYLTVGLSWGQLGEESPCSGGDAPVNPGCAGILGSGGYAVTQAAPEEGAFWVYIFAMEIDPEAGLQSLTFALDFNDEPGVGASFDLGNSINCADYQHAGEGWPAQAGTAITVGWNECQNTPDPNDPEGDAFAIVYALYCHAYSSDEVSLLPWTEGQEVYFSATDCSGSSTDLYPGWPINVGILRLGSEGQAPCESLTLPTPIEPATWGGIKRAYGRQ